MSGVDLTFHKMKFMPMWVLRYKLALNIITISSLLLGVVKGQYLEKHSQYYIMEEAGIGDATRLEALQL